MRASKQGLQAGKDEHVRVLPPSANWYNSKICDWGYNDAHGLLFAFGAKNNVFIYQVGEAQDDDKNTAQQEQGKKSKLYDGIETLFHAQIVRGRKDQRVTAVQILREDSSDDLLVLCGGEEGSVQIWNIATLELVEQHRNHAPCEITVTAGSASLEPNVIIAGDRQGQISIWRRDTGKVTMLKPVSGDCVFAMDRCPQDKELVAVGYRSGVFCVVDIGHGSIRYRLDGHDQEVHNVAWQIPFNSSLNSTTSSTYMWLASSSRDKTIKIWKIPLTATTDESPHLTKVLALPKSNKGSSYSQAKWLWLPIAWSYGKTDKTISSSESQHSSFRLWSGSYNGNLFLWEWHADEAQQSHGMTQKKPAVPCKPTVVKNGHNRFLFSIVTISPIVGLPASKAARLPSMLTTALDREFRLWREQPMQTNSSAREMCVDTLLGLGGHVYSVAYNPHTEVIAAGVGDNTIRLWSINASKSLSSKSTLYQTDLLWKGLKSKITCVMWHPLQQSILAYGTEDGRLGVYDVDSKKHSRFRSFHDHEVKELHWRVKHPKSEMNTQAGTSNSFLEAMKALETAEAEGQTLEEALTAQGNDVERRKRETNNDNSVQILLWSQDIKGNILESNSENVESPSIEVKSNFCACFGFDGQCELVAMGRQNGSVEILAWKAEDERNDSNSNDIDCGKQLTVLRKFHEQMDKVTCIAWSHSTVGMLASGALDGTIFVYNVSPVKHSDGISGSLGLSSSKPSLAGDGVVATLAGHFGTITCLRWCSDTALLASSSADGGVQVWNVRTQTGEGYFQHHVGRVLSVDWISDHILVSGGEDQTIRIWDHRQQQTMVSPIKVLRKESKKQSRKSHQTKTDTKDSPDSVITSDDLGDFEVMAAQNVSNITADKSIESPAPKKSTKSKVKSKKVLVFHSEQRDTNYDRVAEDCRKIAGLCVENQLTGPVENSNELLIDGAWKSLFTADRSRLQNFFAAEEKMYEYEHDWERLAQVYLFQGNIGEALRVVAKAGALSPSWVAYAPMAGMDVWIEVTNAYAHQLRDQGDMKAAAFHFLSISKVHAAVHCYRSAGAYKEAIALIRSRMSSQDPILNDTLWEYAVYLEKHQRYGEAARAYLSTGEPLGRSKAVAALIKTDELNSIEVALDLLYRVYELEGDILSEELTFPVSFYQGVIRKALEMHNFVVAEKAAFFLQPSLLSADARRSMRYRLARCLFGVMNAFDQHRSYQHFLKDTLPEKDRLAIRLKQLHAPPEFCQLFSFMMEQVQSEDTGHERSCQMWELLGSTSLKDSCAADISSALRGRAESFWVQVFAVCDENGVSFGEDTNGNDDTLEAQELLMEKDSFTYLLRPVSTISRKDHIVSYATDTLMKICQCLLQFVTDVMTGCFVGGLERIREALDIAWKATECVEEDYHKDAASSLHVDLVTLLLPGGFITTKGLPLFGELAAEPKDTLIVWCSFLFSQCTAWLSVVTKTTEDDLNTDNHQCVNEMVTLLHEELLSCKSPSLVNVMDLYSQKQMAALLNDMLVLVHGRHKWGNDKTSSLCEDESKYEESRNEDVSQERERKREDLINKLLDLQSQLCLPDELL